jgi:hypothetical protein
MKWSTVAVVAVERPRTRRPVYNAETWSKIVVLQNLAN